MKSTKHLHVLRAYKAYDERLVQVKQDAARHGSPIVVSCTKGCFACCKEPCWASQDEVDYAVDNIPEAELNGVKERTKEWLDRVQKSGMDKISEPNVFQWRAINAWCRSLKTVSAWSHKQRPLACRGHMALGPRQNCEDDELRKNQLFVQVPQLQSIAYKHLLNKNEVSLYADHVDMLLARRLLKLDVKSIDAVAISGYLDNLCKIDSKDTPREVHEATARFFESHEPIT